MGDESNFDDLEAKQTGSAPPQRKAAAPKDAPAAPAASGGRGERPSETAVPVVELEAEGEHWYVVINDREVGPITLAELRTAVREGKVKPQDKVRTEEQDAWVEASQVKELAEPMAELTARLSERQKKKTLRPKPSPPALTEALKQIGLAKDDKGSDAKRKGSDVAHIPSTILTVEYVDSSEGMEASLKALDQRLTKLEDLTQSLEEITSRLVSAVAKQTKDVSQSIESLNRRVDRVYLELQRSGGRVAAPGATQEAAEPEPQFPAKFKEDAEHQHAWQVAQVIVNDLEAYYGDDVREGVMYGNLNELLEGPITEGRKTYEERAPERVRQEFDYFDLALKQLTARKRKEMTQDPPPEKPA